MSDKSKLFFAFALGAAAGIAIVKLLESEKGEELVEMAKEKFASAAGELKKKLDGMEEDLTEFIKNKTGAATETGS